jgi:hypothetical protein
MSSRDRLDGADRKGLSVEIFLAPGRVILWLQYMFPSKKYADIRRSSRHARSPIMTAIYSAIFWVSIIATLAIPDIRVAVFDIIIALYEGVAGSF